eukprot:tig00020930_g16045.t1
MAENSAPPSSKAAETSGPPPDRPGAPPTITVAFLNVESLTGVPRRVWLTRWLKKRHIDVLGLVDHRLNPKEIAAFARRIGPHWSAHIPPAANPRPDTWSRGTGFIVRNQILGLPGAQATLVPLAPRAGVPAHDVTVLRLSSDAHTYFITCVYAANDAGAQRRLAAGLQASLVEPTIPQGASLILGGDFNAYAQPLLESRRRAAGAPPPPFAHWAEMLADLGLQDEHRRRRPDERIYTRWHNKTGRSSTNAARLDHVFLSADLCAATEKVGVLRTAGPAPRPDHDAVYTRLFTGARPVTKSSRFRLQDRVLARPDFDKRVRALIADSIATQPPKRTHEWQRWLDKLITDIRSIAHSLRPRVNSELREAREAVADIPLEEAKLDAAEAAFHSRKNLERALSGAVTIPPDLARHMRYAGADHEMRSMQPYPPAPGAPPASDHATMTAFVKAYYTELLTAQRPLPPTSPPPPPYPRPAAAPVPPPTVPGRGEARPSSPPPPGPVQKRARSDPSRPLPEPDEARPDPAPEPNPDPDPGAPAPDATPEAEAAYPAVVRRLREAALLTPLDPLSHEEAALLAPCLDTAPAPLCAPTQGEYTAKEVGESLQEMNKSTAPGEDGMTVRFYLKFWDVIGPIIAESYNCARALELGTLSERQRMGLIQLLYKKGDRDRIQNWRPITLLQIDRRLYGAVLAKRIAPACQHTISSVQTGFMPDRNGADNVWQMQSVIRYAARELEGKQIVVLNTDFEIESDVRAAIKGARSKVISMLNGVVDPDPIKITRSAMQGDPFACMFFNTQQEPTTRAILADPEITGVPAPGNPGVESKLNQYADDAAHTILIDPQSPASPPWPILPRHFRTGLPGSGSVKHNGSCLSLSKTEGMLAGAAAIRPPQTLPAWAAQIPIRWVSQTTTLGIPLGSTGDFDPTEFWLGKGESMRKARTQWNLRGMRAHQRAARRPQARVLAGTYVKALCDPTFAVWKLFAADDIGTLFSRARSSVARSLGIAALEPLWFNPVLSPTGPLWGTTAADRTLAAGSATSPKITQAGQLSMQVSALGLAPLYRGPAAVRSGPGGDPRVLDPPITAGHSPRRPGPTAVILALPGPPPTGCHVGALPDGTLAEPPSPSQPLPAAPASLPRAHVILVPPGSAKQKQRWPAGRPVLAGRLDATPWVHTGLLFASPKGRRPWLEYRISTGYRALLALPPTPDPGPLARFGDPPPRCAWQTVWKHGCRHASLTAWNREVWLWATHACLPTGQFLHRIGARPSPFCEVCECIDIPEDTSDHAIYYCAPARAAWGELLERWNAHFRAAVPLSCAHAITGFYAVPDNLRRSQGRRTPRPPQALLPALAGLMISAAWRVHQATPEEREQAGKPHAQLIWEAFARDVWARALVAITKAEYVARGLSPADAQPALDPSAITWAWEPDDDPPAPPSPMDPLIWTAAGFVATLERTETETVPSRGPLLEPPPDFDSPDVPW